MVVEPSKSTCEKSVAAESDLKSILCVANEGPLGGEKKKNETP